jgi:type III secretion protein HrpB1
MGSAAAPAFGQNVLAFRTPPGGVTIPAGQSKQLGVVDVTHYERIRIVADERIGSGTALSVRITITEGSELVAQLDVLHLTPHAEVTRTYEVPGTKLTIFADAAPGTGQDGLDVLVYGWKE